MLKMPVGANASRRRLKSPVWHLKSWKRTWKYVESGEGAWGGRHGQICHCSRLPVTKAG